MSTTQSSAPTNRFSTRVADYLRYRPRYPEQLYAILRDRLGLRRQSIVADIGSGTGIFCEPLLAEGITVYCVEPNREMREAGEELLRGYPGFHSVAGTAEATGLPDASVDMITAAQAFHWFDRPKARAEFARILRPGGAVALIWNDRSTSASPFLLAYEDLLRRRAVDYEQVVHRTISAGDISTLEQFFAPNAVHRVVVAQHEQRFDFDGLKGRVLSSSYVPLPGDERHEPLMEELRAIFDRHAENGTVAFVYDTVLYHGRLGGNDLQ
ncbi:MAG TPA: class I SAM-dependent methyltransferase [Candidatus Kapabacteria bacterium]|nr:class I SAM-dependent methyltransferase [Candidatus Kapabacteria bacterium]